MAKRVLLIKLTSMGDLMHALPALTDATRAIPGIQFDWVVDESFAEVPAWHPAVNQIICSAHRRWKKNLFVSIVDGELSRFYHQLNQSDYDIVLDAQNNLKSAVITWLRRGPSHGLDKQSVREKPAHWAYSYHHSADRSQHAVAHQRLLMSEALGYPLPDTEPDHGIDCSRLRKPDIQLPDRYLFFVHNASWTTKLWPEVHWHQLIKLARQDNYQVILPCGNEDERLRANRLAEQHDNTIALPKLPLSEVGWIINNATGAVCCDTGLCHLSGLLDIPAVSFYGPTDSKLIGSTGHNQKHMIASSKDFSCAPCYGRRCTLDDKDLAMSACMEAFKPEDVWSELTELIASN